MSRESIDLEIESGWFIECWRCSNHAFISGAGESASREDFVDHGWRMIDDFQMCPQCLGEK